MTRGRAAGGLVLPGLLTLLALAVLIGLGTWQVQRLAWKEGLIRDVAARLTLAPVPAPGPEAWASLDHAALEYRPVSVTGRFDHAGERHVFTTLGTPKGRFGGPGYAVMTPLVTAEGWTVYVNRGFVPAERKDPAGRAEGQVPGEVAVAGLFRAPQPKSWVSYDDDPDRNVYYTRDPARFAAGGRTGGRTPVSLAPFIIDSFAVPDLPGGLPQGGETGVTFTNNHFGYALTWYGLALALAGVFLGYARSRLGRAGPSG